MSVVDVIAALVVVGVAAWGARAGLLTAFATACFAAGAVAGALLAPRLITGGQEGEFALAVAFPAALLLGGLAAALGERSTARLRRRLRRQTAATTLGGALLGALCGAVLVWLAAGAATQVDALRDDLEDSAVVGRVESVLTPLGPRAERARRPFDPFPIVAGPGPPIGLGDPDLVRDPDVRRADRSTVLIGVFGCRGLGFGSGWVAGEGIVATNAHVVAAMELLRVQVRGRGPRHAGTVIWYDPVNDVALLRVPGLASVPALDIAGDAPPRGVPGAVIGFPGGRHHLAAARIGPTTREVGGRMEGELPGREFPRKLGGRLITTFRGYARPGSSGGPVVDSRGRVLTMVFGGGGSSTGRGLGVPNRFIRRALGRAGPPVKHGSCPR